MADETPGRVAATLTEAKRIADGLQFACRLPDKKPDFTACGGPAAEAYWDYFHPARIASLLAAVEAALKVHQPVDRGTGAQCKGCATHVTFTRWPCPTVRAITAALTGTQPSEDGGDRG